MAIKILPQEVEVWYLIPSLRKELAKVFVRDFKLNQKKSAEILSITEAAVSQYFKSKRAHELKFSAKEIAEIKKTAGKIIRDEKNAMKHFYSLCVKFRGSESICRLHKKHDKTFLDKCDLCK